MKVTHFSIPQRVLALTFTLTALALTLGTVHAQSVYRIVGPDGRVTFSDRPPASGKDMPEGTRVTTNDSARSNPALPYELKQAATRYPVTLYTAGNCSPCASAKALLIQRGVPFTEKTIASNEDLNALQKLGGDGQLPFATIGTQQIKGFSGQEWAQYLDAANYPAQSQLPPSYRNPEPTPLAPPSAKAAPGAAATPQTANTRPARAPRTAAPPATNDKSNPAGIQF